jgi:hypothetical protein
MIREKIVKERNTSRLSTTPRSKAISRAAPFFIQVTTSQTNLIRREYAGHVYWLNSKCGAASSGKRTTTPHIKQYIQGFSIGVISKQRKTIQTIML